MIRNLILLLIEIIIVVVDSIITGIIFIKGYVVKVWKNYIIREWVWKFMDLFDMLFSHIENYLEQLKEVLQFRIFYEKTTKPMNEYYRELKNR